MLLNELLLNKDEIIRIVQQNKGIKAKVFGSTANGNSTKNSDVDILVKFKKDASLFDLIEIKIELEDLLNRSVDVVSEDGLKSNAIGENIRRSAIAIWDGTKYILDK